MSRILIRNGRVLDPANNLDLPSGHVLIEDGKIVAVGLSVPESANARAIDALRAMRSPRSPCQ